MAQNAKYDFRNGAPFIVDADGNASSRNYHETNSTVEHSERIWRESDPFSSKMASTFPFTEQTENGKHLFPPATTGAFSQDTSHTPITDVRLQEAAYKGSQESQESETVEETASTEPPTPIRNKLNKEELAKRDTEAVAYSKALLLEGDTLVFITYPGESRCFDSTGFEISSSPHRVHSSRLLATGSSVFKKLLGSTNQFRTIRRKNLVGHLPPGVQYVLDLTPPDEGDEAVELTAELSCSLGVRHWYRSEQLSHVPRGLVGGEDEAISAQNITSYGSFVENKSEDFKEAISNAPNNDSTESSELLQVAWVNTNASDFEKDLQEAKTLSMKTMPKPKTGLSKLLDVPEYCPVRHRAGIARLLQVLEGKDPRLDSAPKVWTLFVLAKFFDCTNAVVDWIVTWLLADSNTRFIGILPEASCKMAFGLKNQLICRAAFSILVGEEAMSLASREMLKFEADLKKINQFGRIREDIDEDLRTRIEYASKSFASKVCATFDALTDPKMEWFLNVPEYKKLVKFEAEVLLVTGGDERGKKWISTISNLVNGLRLYVRGRLLDTLAAPISHEETVNGNEHRAAEQYTSATPGVSFQIQYRKLRDRERIFTRPLWKMVSSIDLPSWYGQHKEEEWGARVDHGAESRPTYSMVLARQGEVNAAIIEAIKGNRFHNGILPREAFQNPSTNRAYLSQEKFLGKTDPENGRYFMQDWKPFVASHSNATRTHVANQNINSEKFEVPKANISIGTTQPVPALLKKGAMNADEYHIQQLLLDAKTGSRPSFDLNSTGQNTVTSSSTDLPFRPLLPKQTYPQDQANGIPPYPFDFQQATQVNVASQTDSDWWSKESIDDVPKSDSTLLSRLKQLSNRRAEEFSPKPETYPPRFRAQVKFGDPVRYEGSVGDVEPLPPCVPHDYDISEESLFFNMTRFFLEAKEHVRRVANSMLATPQDMGFDIVTTDTLICLGSEEFKYLPLWAGGDDDDSGGVFDDAIPVALAGPNGPGPSYHTGFSTASATSSEFDAMSDRTAFNTSVGVEDGYSDHLDRRVVLADDDFHSETFSEDSEIYDRKGKGVARDGFYTSAPSSVAGFSAAETISETALTEENFDMYDVRNEEDDNDTTVGEGDDDDHDVWDEGDAESFDFGDSDGDEEMVTV